MAVRLETWGIRIDDSAGRPVAKTMPGAFLDLVVEAVATEFAPAALVALMKHPLTRLGLPAGEIRRTARALEIAAFRTLYIGKGLDGAVTAAAITIPLILPVLRIDASPDGRAEWWPSCDVSVVQGVVCGSRGGKPQTHPCRSA